MKLFIKVAMLGLVVCASVGSAFASQTLTLKLINNVPWGGPVVSADLSAFPARNLDYQKTNMPFGSSSQTFQVDNLPQVYAGRFVYTDGNNVPQEVHCVTNFTFQPTRVLAEIQGITGGGVQCVVTWY